MPIKYFDTFPKIDYRMKDGDVPTKVTDITRRVGIRKDFTNLISSYYKQNLQSAERPEVLSNMAYNSSAYHWVLMHINNVVDPYHDWIIDYNTLEEYVASRYPDRYIDVTIQSSLGSITTTQNLPGIGERIWNTLIHGTVTGTFQNGEYIQESETGVVAYALLANHTNVNNETGIVPTGITGGDYFTKDNTIVGLTSGATATVTNHRSAKVIDNNRDLQQIVYKMVSSSTSGTSFLTYDYILTDRQLFSLVTFDGLETHATRYYEVSRTNSDGTVDKLQTNKTLSSEDITNLPSGFSTVPVAVSNWEHESRENEKNRSVNILDSNNLDAFETDFVSKMSD